MTDKERIAGNEEGSRKTIKFFEYKRNMQSVMDQFIENGGFADRDQMKKFIYNEQQENPDGIIMEVNTASVGGPGLIEIVDGADTAYMKDFPTTAYSRIVKELQTMSVHENNPKYFENYILSELKNKNAERIIILFGEEKDCNFTAKDIGLDKEYAVCVGLETFNQMLKDRKFQLATTLLMSYGFVQEYKPEEYFKPFKRIFQDRYLNKENVMFSSKQRPSILGREELTGPYLDKIRVDEKYGADITKTPGVAKALEQSYILKQAFIDQGKGICFPGERKFTEGNLIIPKTGEDKKIDYYALQRFHELPRKITLENGGTIMPKTVDIRAYVTFDAEEQDIDVQIFGREGNIGKVSNVSSGGKFTKVYIVKDETYYDAQSKIDTLITGLGSMQNNAIEKRFDQYAQKNFKIVPDAKISPIPFVLSLSGAKRIYDMVYKLINNMIDEGFITMNDEGRIVGNTVIGIDISINPLPKE